MKWKLSLNLTCHSTALFFELVAYLVIKSALISFFNFFLEGRGLGVGGRIKNILLTKSISHPDFPSLCKKEVRLNQFA